MSQPFPSQRDSNAAGVQGRTTIPWSHSGRSAATDTPANATGTTIKVVPPCTSHLRTGHLSRHIISSLAIAAAIATVPLSAADPKPEEQAKAKTPQSAAYLIEDIALPAGFDPGIGALAFNEAGELVVVSRHTGIIIGHPKPDPAAFTWRTFCDQSLHQPLGVLAETGGSLLVPQMAELTRLYDTDKDGLADYIEAVSTAWGVSGNDHATHAGPLPDGEGNWFVALGTGSSEGSTFTKVRGEYSPGGRRGQRFSAAPFNGWIVKITPAGELLPWASGFRQCNGIGMNAEGDLFATDSHGDWKATTRLYHVEEGNFYGHPSSLVWNPEFAVAIPDPLSWAIEQRVAADRMRTRPAVHLPHGSLCDSAGEPVFDHSARAFGPFADQLFIGDIAGQRILRIMLEKVDGKYQGAVTHFIDSAKLGAGNGRLCFSPDGSQLYVGQSSADSSGTAPADGLKRITWTGKVPYAISRISLAADGFELTFTHAVDRALAADVANYSVRHFNYAYSQKVDGPLVEETFVTPTHAILTPDARGVTLQFDQVVADRIYEFDFARIVSQSKASLEHGIVCYTVNKLRPESKGRIKFKPRPEPQEEPTTPEPVNDTAPEGSPENEKAGQAAKTDIPTFQEQLARSGPRPSRS